MFQYMQYFFKFLFSFYVGLKIDEINRRIAEIKVPHQVKRGLRPLTERVNYKASEWRTFGLYFAAHVFQNILPDR